MMKTKIRRILESWQRGKVQAPQYIARGAVFLYPSNSGEFPHHLVVWMQRRTPKREYVEFACSCMGYGYSRTDTCRHIEHLKSEITKMKTRALKGGKIYDSLEEYV